ncbi:MAG: class I SAM-dependent methyltransferase [bacterium]|nr:class I SAM-dependent methyltransferase [bacterium]
MTTNKYITSEKQLITSLAWFRSRYALFMGLSLERAANKQNIEAFGKRWIGAFKVDWEDAFISLSNKNIIECSNNEYSFTDHGNSVKDDIDTEIPFYKYEYDNYFQLEHNSKAHAKFCEMVYGLNLSQHGLIDQAELSIVIDQIKINAPNSILDIGCGNGKITEWIAEQTQTGCVGIDISSEAIMNANKRTKDHKFLKFEEGNLNDLSNLKEQDAVLFLDTLYYSNNLKNTISQAHELLNAGGRIYAYFSQWIMDVHYHENLQVDKTHLANVLNELKLNYTHTNLTKSGIVHWKKKLEVLNLLKNEFIAEGSDDLWKYRHQEAERYANWGDDKYARYLYEIKK